MQVNQSCHFGCSDEDSIHHVFFSCHLAKAAWFGCFSMCPPSHLPLSDFLIWLKRFLVSLRDDEILIKSIISLLNDISRKRNQVAHGGSAPHPQDIIKDSQSIVAFSALAFREKTSHAVHHQASVAHNFSGANHWTVFVKKWKLHRSSYCRILVCFEASHIQTFMWKRTTIPGGFFALGCFRHALNWIHQSGLSEEHLTVWNIRKRSIDFNCWAPSVKHTIAQDISFLISPFTFVSINLLSSDQFSTFAFNFHDVVRPM